MVETMAALTQRLAGDIDDLARGDSNLVRELTSRPLGDVLRLTGDAETAGARSVAAAADGFGDHGVGRAAPVRGAFTRLPEPEHARLYADIWRGYADRRSRSRAQAERMHDNTVYNTRFLLRRSGLSDDLENPVLPGTPEFDRMLDAADSDLFIYVVRSDGPLVIVPERIQRSRFNHDGLILRADDTVTAAGEVRINGRAGNYTVPVLSNKSGGFTPPPGTLSASALPAFEQHGLFPQQVMARELGQEYVTYVRGE